MTNNSVIAAEPRSGISSRYSNPPGINKRRSFSSNIQEARLTTHTQRSNIRSSPHSRRKHGERLTERRLSSQCLSSQCLSSQCLRSLCRNSPGSNSNTPNSHGSSSICR